jgi:hypothetical protein
VQWQLGHASIQMTVDTYGKWLPMGNKVAVGTLDSWPTVIAEKTGKPVDGSSVVAERTRELFVNQQPTDLDGGPRRTRTFGPLIKSQLLYQLS